MTSLLCVKNKAGSVQVHDVQRVGSLTVNDKHNAANALLRERFMPRPSIKKVSTLKRPMSTPNLGSSTGSLTLDSSSFIRSFGREGSWLSKKQFQELQEQSLSKNSESREGVGSPLLETEKTFVKDVTDYLDNKDMMDLRKKEVLHKNWNSRVYEPIRQKVIQAMDSQRWTDKERRRRELHRQYLEHVNKKGHVFLDTMDEGEYYAQALNQNRPAEITVYTDKLHDPLLAQERGRSHEDQVILRCLTGQLYSQSDINQVRLPPLPLVPLGRHGIDSTVWLEMPLDNIESTPRRTSRLRMRGNCTDSQIDFPQWSKMQFDAKILDHEMQLQKKRAFKEKPPYGIPVRQFDKAPFATTITCYEQNALCAVNT